MFTLKTSFRFIILLKTNNSPTHSHTNEIERVPFKEREREREREREKCLPSPLRAPFIWPCATSKQKKNPQLIYNVMKDFIERKTYQLI